jgi:hypothetical protein
MSTKQCDWLMKQMMQEELDRKEQELMKRRGMEEDQIAREYNLDALQRAYKQDVDKIDMSTVSRDDHTVIDPLLKTIEGTVWDQQAKVLASGKYPHPIHKDNHTAVEWMDHQMSEFADALVYHECLKQTIREVYELIDYAFQKSKDDQVDALLIQALNRLKRG